MKREPMTVAGAEALRNELERLTKVERPRIVNAIAEARAHGDLKENAEYHAAREQQSFTEGRINEIEAKLSTCEVIDVSRMENTGTVIFGATVKLINLDTEDVVQYKIVGEDESDIKLQKISYNSPIARALIGKHVGDEVDVRTPAGVNSYEINAVEYL